MSLIQLVQSHLHHADGAVHDHLAGVDDGGGLLTAQHDRRDLRGVGQVGDLRLDDFQTGRLHLALNLLPDPGGYDLTGSSQAALVRDTVSGGVHAGGHVIGVDADDVPQSAVALKGQVLLVVVHLKDGLGGIHHAPHDGDADLDGVAQAVVDLLTVVVEGHDFQGDAFAAGGLGFRFGRGDVLAVYISALAEFGLGGRVDGGAEGVDKVEAGLLQGDRGTGSTRGRSR